jgi:signal transduction histidine kinase
MVTAVEGHDLASPLPATAEISLFRIAQEALLNAAKHSRASRASVRLEEASGTVRLTVSDDGVGFAHGVARRNTAGWGLPIMRERAAAMGGTLRVESEPGKGTRIIVEVGR